MEPSKPSVPATLSESDLAVVRYNAKLGMTFFLVYLCIYALFVGLCTFRLDLMSTPWIGGVNIAIWYGFGLIAAAFVMAVAFLMLCRR